MGVLSWKNSSKQTPTNGVEDNHRMSFTVFLGNLPAWVTADDIKGWLTAENLVADAIKVIRNPETQESKGFAFIEAPNTDEMNSIIRRFDRAPLEDRLLRANPAQPPRPKGSGPPFPPGQQPPAQQRPHSGPPPAASAGTGAAAPSAEQRPPRRTKRPPSRRPGNDSQSPFAEELAKVL
jgi:RNA recognition motif-containing protein